MEKEIIRKALKEKMEDLILFTKEMSELEEDLRKN